MVFTNVVLNFLFIGPLRHGGIALATTLSVSLGCIFLFFFLVKKTQQNFNVKKLLAILTKAFVSSLIMALCCLPFYNFLYTSIKPTGMIAQGILLSVVIGLAGIAYLGISIGLKTDPVLEYTYYFRDKFFKKIHL